MYNLNAKIFNSHIIKNLSLTNKLRLLIILFKKNSKTRKKGNKSASKINNLTMFNPRLSVGGLIKLSDQILLKG